MQQCPPDSQRKARRARGAVRKWMWAVRVPLGAEGVIHGAPSEAPSVHRAHPSEPSCRLRRVTPALRGSRFHGPPSAGGDLRVPCAPFAVMQYAWHGQYEFLNFRRRSGRPRQVTSGRAASVDASSQRSDHQIATAHANQPIWTPGRTRCDTYTITPMPPGSLGVGCERTLLAHATRPRQPRSADGVPPRVREPTDEP
jgi:hypothetical protein